MLLKIKRKNLARGAAAMALIYLLTDVICALRGNELVFFNAENELPVYTVAIVAFLAGTVILGAVQQTKQ